ncbi:MAG: sugar phosphate nucleotidyltransferase [Candidatus Daviesbacteria bacterium]|nr:sugar phosphate nucleotidyltransferase [Candidatus Daviesbacteria bacterium]
MKVIILCGGVGTRLKEETEFKPKPMVEVGGKPLIWHIMKIYAHYGFNEFILALGYKGNYIKDFFLNQKAFTTDFTLNTKTYKTTFHLKNRKEDGVDVFNITFVDTGVESPTSDRIIKCKKYIPETDKEFMVTYGDGVSNIDLKKLLEFHRHQKTIGTITGVHPSSKFGLVKTNENNPDLVKSFQEKPVLSDWVNGGFMVFTKEIFKYLKPEEMDHAAYQRIADDEQLSVYKHEGFWYAVDTSRELENLKELWNNNPYWKIW